MLLIWDGHLNYVTEVIVLDLQPTHGDMEARHRAVKTATEEYIKRTGCRLEDVQAHMVGELVAPPGA